MHANSSLVCRDCGASFTFTSGEQDFYARLGFSQPPTRCAACRAERKAERSATGEGGFANRGPRRMFQATCSTCGAGALVPFQPRPDQPVSCTSCHERQRKAL